MILTSGNIEEGLCPLDADSSSDHPFGTHCRCWWDCEGPCCRCLAMPECGEKDCDDCNARRTHYHILDDFSLPEDRAPEGYLAKVAIPYGEEPGYWIGWWRGHFIATDSLWEAAVFPTRKAAAIMIGIEATKSVGWYIDGKLFFADREVVIQNSKIIPATVWREFPELPERLERESAGTEEIPVIINPRLSPLSSLSESPPRGWKRWWE